jgi:hypothetical protein
VLAARQRAGLGRDVGWLRGARGRPGREGHVGRAGCAGGEREDDACWADSVGPGWPAGLKV